MRKLFIVVLFLMGSILFASGSEKYFIGVHGGYEESSGKVVLTILSDEPNSVTEDDAGQEYLVHGLKVGEIKNENLRLYFESQFTNREYGLVSIPITFNFDYIFDQTILNFRPFVGMGFGYARWNESLECVIGDDVVYEKTLKLGGKILQTKLGLIYPLKDNIDLELYYRYARIIFTNKECESPDKTVKVRADVDNIELNGVFLGFTYKF